MMWIVVDQLVIVSLIWFANYCALNTISYAAFQTIVSEFLATHVWQFYYISFNSERHLIPNLLCWKSRMYWLAVRLHVTHWLLRRYIQYGIRTVKQWNWSAQSSTGVAAASSFSKLLILLLAHLETHSPSGESNSVLYTTKTHGIWSMRYLGLQPPWNPFLLNSGWIKEY